MVFFVFKGLFYLSLFFLSNLPIKPVEPLTAFEVNVVAALAAPPTKGSLFRMSPEASVIEAKTLPDLSTMLPAASLAKPNDLAIESFSSLDVSLFLNLATIFWSCDSFSFFYSRAQPSRASFNSTGSILASTSVRTSYSVLSARKLCVVYWSLPCLTM